MTDVPTISLRRLVSCCLLYTSFGETRSTDCKVCDVCVSSGFHSVSDLDLRRACDQILSLLADKERHRITELNKLVLPNKQMNCALEYLANEEMIHIDGPFIHL